MTEIDSPSAEPEFRHTIGDCLYELHIPYEMNDAPDEVRIWPIAKKTDRYVYVRGIHFWDEDRTYRFSREDLETKGRAWNRANRFGLYTRPLPHWPLLVVAVDGPRAIAS